MNNLLVQIEEIARQNELKDIIKIKIQIGKLRQVVPESMHFAFDAIIKDTPFKNAKLKIEEIPITGKCSECAHEFEIKSNLYKCTKCQSSEIKIIKGQDIILASIEGEK